MSRAHCDNRCRVVLISQLLKSQKLFYRKKKKSKPLVIHFSLGHLRAGLTKKVSFPIRGHGRRSIWGGSTSAPCGSNFWWITFFVMQITCYLCDYSWLGALPWVNSNLLLISNLWAGPRVGSRSRKIHWSWARPNIYFNSDPGPPWTYTKLQPVYIPNWQTIIQSDLWGPVCSWTLDMKGLSNILCCQNLPFIWLFQPWEVFTKKSKNNQVLSVHFIYS